MLKTLLLQALTESIAAQELDRIVLQNAGSDTILHIIPGAGFENDGFDAERLEQVREHESRGSRADDSDLRSGGGHSVAPDFVRYLQHASELRPLLILCQQIAFFGARESALRAEAELPDVDVFRGCVDPAFEVVLRLKLGGFRAYDAEDDGLVFRRQAQGFETSGAFGVVLHEVAVHIDLAEENIGHRIVPAGCDPARTEVATAKMHGDHHVRRTP